MTGRTIRRRAVATLAGIAVLGLAQCTPSDPGRPEVTTTPTASGVSTPLPPLTRANLPRVVDLPLPIGDGSVHVYRKNARTLDAVTICLDGPVSSLGPTATEMRSYRNLSRKGKPPFPSAQLDGQPDTYAVALQFADVPAALRAKSLVETWVVGCRAGTDLPADVHVTGAGFDWTDVGNHVGQPRIADVSEAAEVAYRLGAAKADQTTFESVGLTVVGPRMMITVHLFATDESPYSTNPDDDEAGFTHPQVGLVQAAARSLRR